MGRIRLILAMAIAMVVFSAGTALAGEITGTGESLKQDDGTLHGESACAWSGLNDEWDGDPDEPGIDGFYRTQSWGQIPKAFRDFLSGIGFHPGDACNPNVGEPGH